MRVAARRDLYWVAALTLLCFVLSVRWQLTERLAGLMQRFEAWQLDELPLCLTALGIGVAWYAWRRQKEAQALLAQNRALAQQLIAVQESERLALARELHDEMAQHCTVIRIEAAYMLRAQLVVQGLAPAHAKPGPVGVSTPSQSRQVDAICAAAQRAAQGAEQLQQSLRGLLRRLRPPELDELGLVAALQAMCQAWSLRTGVACVFESVGSLPPQQTSGTDTTIDATAQLARDTALYRVAQEALSNVMRHAQARHVRMSLNLDEQDSLALTVSDDGCGFERSANQPGLGLRGAQERAALFGGHLQLSSATGRGTRLRLQLPHLTQRQPAPAA